MPILNVEIVGKLEDQIKTGLAATIAEKAGLVFDSPPNGTWVKIHYIPEQDYAENSDDGKPVPRPVFVSVIQADLPSDSHLEQQAKDLTLCIAGAVERPPENVHVIIEPAARGRIAFGGTIRR